MESTKQCRLFKVQKHNTLYIYKLNAIIKTKIYTQKYIGKTLLSITAILIISIIDFFLSLDIICIATIKHVIKHFNRNEEI